MHNQQLHDAGIRQNQRIRSAVYLADRENLYQWSQTSCKGFMGNFQCCNVTDFISDMAAAYSAADVVISRAGAGSISEFCLLGKPVILVPFPNVAEDHQTKMHWHLSTRMRHFTLKIAKQLKTVGYCHRNGSQTRFIERIGNNITKLAIKTLLTIIARKSAS